jgi:hypothetical protein
VNENLLPNFETAIVDLAKLADYALNPDHPTGQHKAFVFSSVLGFGKEDAEELKQIILETIKYSPAVVNK